MAGGGQRAHHASLLARKLLVRALTGEGDRRRTVLASASREPRLFSCSLWRPPQMPEAPDPDL